MSEPTENLNVPSATRKTAWRPRPGLTIAVVLLLAIVLAAYTTYVLRSDPMGRIDTMDASGLRACTYDPHAETLNGEIRFTASTNAPVRFTVHLDVSGESTSGPFTEGQFSQDLHLTVDGSIKRTLTYAIHVPAKAHSQGWDTCYLGVDERLPFPWE